MSGLTRMTLRLARNPEAGYPTGDDRHGYVVVAPLRQDGHLDAEAWKAHRAQCTVPGSLLILKTMRMVG